MFKMNQFLTLQFYNVMNKSMRPSIISRFNSYKAGEELNAESPISSDHEMELDRRRKLRIENSKILSDDDQKDNILSKYMAFTYKYQITTQFMIQKQQTDIFRKIRQSQSISEEGAEHLGCDLAVAHMVVALGGRVKVIGQNRWFELGANERSYLPAGPVKQFNVEAIDLSHTHIMYEGMQYLCKLKELSWLSLRDCPFITDHCIARLHGLKNSLRYLDLGRCVQISDRGLSTLYSLRELRKLCLDGNSQLENKQLVSLLLEEMNPGLFVDGVDFFAPLPKEIKQKLLTAASQSNDYEDEDRSEETNSSYDDDSTELVKESDRDSNLSNRNSS